MSPECLSAEETRFTLRKSISNVVITKESNIGHTSSHHNPIKFAATLSIIFYHCYLFFSLHKPFNITRSIKANSHGENICHVAFGKVMGEAFTDRIMRGILFSYSFSYFGGNPDSHIDLQQQIRTRNSRYHFFFMIFFSLIGRS